MKRLRLLAAILGCLAILAGGFATVATAAAPLETASSHATASESCSHCDDCGDVPCPMPLADCLQASSPAYPTIAVAPAAPPAIGSSKIRWAFRISTLNGLSTPPDPFPPRA